MVTSTSNVMDDAQRLPWSTLRLGASSTLPLGAAVLLLVFIALISWGAAAASVLASLAAAVGCISLARRAVAQAAELAARSDLQVRIERAGATASRALLKRDVADPVGTALGALIDGVAADAVFLETNSHERPDENGNLATVRDVLYRDNPDGRPGRWELTGWRVGPKAQQALASGCEHATIIADLDKLTNAFYRAAEIGSEVLLPITIEGKWVGSLGFLSRTRGRLWSADEKQLLRVTAEMIGVYWERRDDKAKLEDLLAAKDEFIASVSHEVRTPLTAVLGFAAELDEHADKFSEEERADLIALLADQSREVANIVDDLLTAARAEAGTIVISPQVVSMRSLIGEVLSSHSKRVDVVMSDDIDVWADGGRTRQILRNLLTNADRYGGDIVTISVRPAPEKMILVEVRDNGEGIPYHMRDQIFEPYARVNNSSTQPASVGLGLSVARQLANLMDGSLLLSEEDGWTVFSLTLPAAESPVLSRPS